MHIKPYSGPVDHVDEMNHGQKASFNSGYRTMLLPKGFELWRFISLKSDDRFGTFWMDGPTMKSIMQTFHDNNEFAESYKKEVIRSSLAILEEWSNINWRLKVKLRKDVIAYVGETGTQKQFKEFFNTMPFGGGEKMLKVTETRLGRQIQYVIPRFRGMTDNNDYAAIELFVHI